MRPFGIIPSTTGESRRHLAKLGNAEGEQSSAQCRAKSSGCTPKHALLHFRCWISFCSEWACVNLQAPAADWPSSPGDFHPEALTDPDVNLSIHPARATT